ncbi:MAG TPA: YceD family protein [Gammaproteobacteria bacterium]|jgi:uncharacterized protein|nr:YceD family protein [Gammaproteobacteria bacterium]
MSGSLDAWYSRRELEALADREGVLSGELRLSRLRRLVGMLYSDAGSVRASLRFSQRRDGWLAVDLDYAATVELVCQRCLEPFRRELAGRSKIVLADAVSLPATVPEGYEPFELEEGRLLPALLIEDELIVSIPLAPKHERLADCGSVARTLTVSTEGSGTEAGTAEQ